MKPILFTFRRCPYAIRARLAIKISGVEVEMHEVSLRNKPQAMLDCSPKGTVPVLKLADGPPLEQSLDIMHWALAQHDPAQWLSPDPAVRQQAQELIQQNDGPFKGWLDRYKYAARFPEYPAAHYRAQGEAILAQLDARIARHGFLCGERPGLADMAIFPFIRQFAHVDEAWFYASEYKSLAAWLDQLLASSLFDSVMQK
ncbi:glutathione S-transferase [Collimonas sp. OK412]|uniref:glutathione S-transferase n=1 Tax=Collimonas sp. (strain OK412) TaxID=1801619 RepID=UPI0008E8ACEA|nr:glutathione S-transferase [Collimonas sp. OK412]SFC93289.1 Glutathione S-transferase [Collimonas sp. OK412]